MPACAYAAFTRPEQSKQEGPDPPQQYRLPSWCSAHRSAVTRCGLVAAEAGTDVPGTRRMTMTAAANAATTALSRTST